MPGVTSIMAGMPFVKITTDNSELAKRAGESMRKNCGFPGQSENPLPGNGGTGSRGESRGREIMSGEKGMRRKSRDSYFSSYSSRSSS